MSQAAVVLRFEWRSLLAERAPRLALVVLAIGVVFAARGAREWKTRQHTAVLEASRLDSTALRTLRANIERRAADTTRLTAFGPRNPYSVGTSLARRWVTLPPQPLGPLAAGQSDLFTNYYRVSMFSRETLYANDELENPAHLLAGRLDLAFVVIVIYPLLVIALAYNMLSLERERGTLRLLLAQPVRLRTILLGKVAARAGAFVVVTVAIVLLGALAGGAEVSAPGAWVSLASWSAVTAAYGCLWFALALMVNAFGWPSAANALALLGAWLVAVVLVPSVLAAAVGAWAPAPSRIELVQAQRTASDTATARGAQALAAFMQDHPELLPAGQSVSGANVAARNLAVQEDIVRSIAPVTRRYEAQLTRQQAAAERWRVLSPALVVHDALTTLAGTDAARYRRFLRAADAYVVQLRSFYTPAILAGTPFNASDVAAIPSFAWTDASSDTIARAMIDTLLLAGLAIAFVGGALLVARKRTSLID